jgi:hypothetical protein
VVRAWVKLIWNSLGVAVVAVAAQLAIATALDIVRWTDVGNPDVWRAVLTWITFIYAVAVLSGAAVGRRAVRRPGRPDGIAARIAAVLASGVGATVAVALAWLPAHDAEPPNHVHPELVVAMTAGAGIVAGIILAAAALFVPPIAGGARAAVIWIWLAGIGTAAEVYFTHRAFAVPRLAVVDAPSVIPTAVWSGPMAMVGIAAILGLGVAIVARWGGARRLGVAVSGLAGPAVVAAAYLIAGPGASPQQNDPYRASLFAAGAGLIASVLVALPPGRRSGGRAPTSPAAGARHPRSYQDRSYDEQVYDEDGSYATEPVPVPKQYDQEWFETEPYQPSYPRPELMGQPPRSYDEDYSDWLRDLGHVPGDSTPQSPR